MPLQSGTLARSYVFEHELGVWAFGTVQALREKGTDALRTCKFMPKSALKNSPATVINELRKLQSLQHRHICRITEVLDDDMYIYIISEKCNGGDLGDWVQQLLREDMWMQEEAVVVYVRQALMAICHSHSCKTTHCDLRPSSLALTSKDADATIKVCDVGVATILDPENEQPQIQGNPYSAPEVLELSPTGEAFRSRADVWSVGAIAHALLVGRPPDDSLRRRATDNASKFWALSAAALLVGRSHEDEGWPERSDDSREFVDFLLQSPLRRPTAAQALMHPWLRTSMLPTSVGGETDHKHLVYMLAVMLLPLLLKYRDIYMLRVAFSHVDSDCDGLITFYQAERLLTRSSSCPSEFVAAALECIDLLGCGVVDLCSLLCADVLSREFLATSGAGNPRARAELMAIMIRRFFDLYGAGSTSQDMRKRLDGPAGRDVELHCGVCYDTIIDQLPDGIPLEQQSLISGLIASCGDGTPLKGDCHLGAANVDQEDGWGGFDWLLSNVLRPCGTGGSKRRDGECRSDILGPRCETMTSRCIHEY